MELVFIGCVVGPAQICNRGRRSMVNAKFEYLDGVVRRAAIAERFMRQNHNLLARLAE